MDWASTEMPAIERAHQQYLIDDVIVLGINATNQDNLPQATAFVDSLSLTFPILLDQQGDVMALYRVTALPTTFFIDTDGVIQEVVIGGPMAEALLTSRMQNLVGGH